MAHLRLSPRLCALESSCQATRGCCNPQGLKHVPMSKCKLLWLTPSILFRKKSSFYKPTMTCSVNSKARLCLWKVLRHKCLKPSTSVSKVKYHGHCPVDDCVRSTFHLILHFDSCLPRNWGVIKNRHCRIETEAVKAIRCRVVEMTHIPHKPFPFAQGSVTHSCREGDILCNSVHQKEMQQVALDTLPFTGKLDNEVQDTAPCILTGEALCGETGFCCSFWTPNWCPQKSLFSIP